jgi:NADP-dependent 3-hydroxy acid dehydrogenase YdfG
MKQLRDRVAVVTGAANGIGRALSGELVGEGMRVVLADIEAEPLEQAAKELAAAGGDVLAVPTDVADLAAVEALAAATLERFGAVHLLCNNAAVAGQFGRIWATSLQEWEWIFSVNVMGVVHGLHVFVPILLEQEEAHILNTGSAACFEALPGFGVYAASKHAVLGLSEALKRELSGAGANVGVTVGMPAGVAKTTLMESERNWPARLGPLPPADDDPLPAGLRQAFYGMIAEGNDPALCARALVDGVKRNLYLVCDDMEQMAAWSTNHDRQGHGEVPTWPPAGDR